MAMETIPDNNQDMLSNHGDELADDSLTLNNGNHGQHDNTGSIAAFEREQLPAGTSEEADSVIQLNDTRLAEVYQQARAIIESDDPLDIVENAIRAVGYGGDIKPAKTIYLSFTSRLLAMREGAMPVHTMLAGLTSVGKTFTVRIVIKFLPPEAYLIIDAASPRVLIYENADFQYKVLIFAEADSLPAGEDNPAASAVRNLLQDHYLHYRVTRREAGTGGYTVQEINRPGPTVLITTSTKPLGDQLNSRFFTLECSDTAEQIAAALGAQARIELGETTEVDSALVAFQLYLQLKAPWQVFVPFAGELATAMGRMQAAPRILRDYARLMSLIKAVAVLRHHHRQTDPSGRIVAELDDYETVRLLIGDMYAESSSGATANIRQLVEAVQELHRARPAGTTITNTAIARHLGINVKQVTRRAQKAMRQGWLVNGQQLRSYPADYTVGEPMPPADGLPVLAVNRVNTVQVVDNGDGNDIS
jgi:hypothetical protein